MSLSAAGGFALIDRLLAALGLIRENRRLQSERIDKALYALYMALNETRSYVSSLNRGMPRNSEKECAIARLWSDASVPLRTIDRDLAERCFIKSGYWLEPDTWSELMIKEQRIGLTQVLKSTRNLLMG